MLKKNERNVLNSGAILYPVIENLSVMNSNAYILATDKAVLLIDPGGTEERAAELETIVNGFLAEKERPLALLLTHCHWDHANAITYFSEEFRKKYVMICSEDTAEIISKPDEDFTVSKFFGSVMPVIKPDITLFSEKEVSAGPFQVRKNGFSNEIVVDGEVLLSARYAPGHSPDGVFYFYNEFAFIGDLFFSLNPGVVGIPGWNAEQFRKSAILLRNISEDNELTYCNGHGLPALSTESAATLQSLIANAFLYENVTPISLAHVKSLQNYYFLLLREIDRLLGVFSDRLHYLGGVLQKMGEASASSKFSEDGLLLNLERTVSQFRGELEQKCNEGKIVPLMLAILGSRMIHKVKKNLQGNPYREFLDPSLARRIEFLLTDFSNALSSLPFAEQETARPFGESIRMFIDSLKTKVDRSTIPTDSDEAFLLFLMKRIAMKNALHGCRIVLADVKGEFSAEVCWEHFHEALRDFLERIAECGDSSIRLEIIRNGLIVRPSKGITPDIQDRFNHGLGREFLKRIGCHTAFSDDMAIILLPDKSL